MRGYYFMIQHKMSNNYGMKIMKKGKDITSTDVLDYRFWSKHPSLNIKLKGQISLTTTINEYDEPIVATATIHHGFGYKPQFMAFTRSYAEQYLSKAIFNNMELVNLNFDISYDGTGQNISESVGAYVTDQDLFISATIYGWSPYFSGQVGIEWTYPVDYMLFMEEAEAI